jgi:hypothetical protein
MYFNTNFIITHIRISSFYFFPHFAKFFSLVRMLFFFPIYILLVYALLNPIKYIFIQTKILTYSNIIFLFFHLALLNYFFYIQWGINSSLILVFKTSSKVNFIHLSMVIFHFINHIHSLYFSTNAKISSKGSMKFLQLFTQLNTNQFNSHANK